MSNSSSSIGIGSLLFWIMIAYLVFSEFNDDTEEVKIIDQDKPAIVEVIKESGKNIFNEGKIIIKASAEKIKEELNKQTKTKKEVEETVPESKSEDEKPKEMITEQKPENIEIKPPNDKGMKKL